MKALVFDGIERIAHTTVADPEICHPLDAIVKVKLCAICGSDLHVYHGRESGLDHGTVMGHEFMGEIVELGKDVNNISIGDRVVSAFSTSCGHCYFCREGLTSRCQASQVFGWVQHGQGLQGAQAEYVRVPNAQHTLMKPSPELSDEQSLMLGDILSTGYHAAKSAAIKPGGTCAIVGCGPVGMMAAVGALEQGAESVFIIDRIPERLAIAERFGATPINFDTTDAIQVINDATDGRGADAVMEVVGSPQASSLAFDLVRAGGIISIAGVHNEPHFTISPTQAYDKNLTIVSGRCPARAYMETLQDVAKSGRYDLSAIISHRITLQEGCEGYDMFANRRDNCTKVVLSI